ncbi:MAG: GLPGLI family protein [Cellulophaga sp.]|uniref:GLPGLI family protein n=1 Tax=unclassified Cellulophaga TaxID=2634405 RepID=UPI0026E2CEFC|nr:MULTISPECIES: GLPGLI family protein [unclassified Cellulophaga]MDO6491056.1 GLPGLI family protein [Cellulophaga sp. 2_MG-2023]MDO6493750.1 GLPGLI family protein [Cellulophaga sp. 3_MG-2023]
MLRNTFLIIITLLTFYSAFAQKDSINIYKVLYERTLSIEEGRKPFIGVYELNKFVELNKSIYTKKSKSKITEVVITDEDDDSRFTFTPTGKNISTLFKDYNNGTFYSKHEVAYKYFVVKDSLNIFNWSIQNNSKEILGFKCQLATMDFRGRKYEAWFTSDLPVGGPYKYDGLPGMILELKSIDNFISFKPIKIKNTKLKLATLENPFDTKDALTWQDYKDLYKKKAIELLSYRPNENTGGVVSSRGGIELYIDEDDKEYNDALDKYHKKFSKN